MYFEFFELKSWGKRSANNRRRFNQWLLQGSLCGFAAIRGGKISPLQLDKWQSVGQLVGHWYLQEVSFGKILGTVEKTTVPI